MKQKTGYFKVGLFAVLSLALVIMFLIGLGINHLFEHHEIGETYFNESIQGLNIGSPVKYRGVTVGKVTQIKLIDDVYTPKNKAELSQENRYIYVQFTFTPQLPQSEENKRNIQNIVEGYVKNGFRASLATQDLVGNVFLSLNFADKQDAEQLLPISWTPQHLYIPSTQSTLGQLTNTISNLAARFNKIDFDKVVKDIDHLTLTIDKTVEDAQIAQLSKKLSATLDDASTAMQQFNTFSSKMSQYATSQQKIWETTFSGLQQMSLNLITVSNTLKNNPSAIVFGQAAKPVDPTS